MNVTQPNYFDYRAVRDNVRVDVEHTTVVTVSLDITVKSDAPLEDSDKLALADWVGAELQSNAEYGTDLNFTVADIQTQVQV